MESTAATRAVTHNEGIHIAPETIELEVQASIDALADEFGPSVSRDEVSHAIRDAVANLEPANVETFVPVLAQRQARRQLAATATSAPTTSAPTTSAPTTSATAATADAGIGVDQILVGVDGSEPALHALRWAAEEAELRGGRCQVIEVWPHGASGFRDAWSSHELVDEHLEAMVDAVCSPDGLSTTPDVELRIGDPLEVLAAAARNAEMTVVGTRGHSVVQDLFLGSVSAGLLHKGIGPTVVISPEARIGRDHRRIVVGVDGSDSAARALKWATTEAILRHAELIVLHAWHMPTLVGSPYVPTIPISYQECQQESREFLARVATTVPADAGVRIVTRSVDALADHALVAAAGDADLLVVGSRGHSEITAAVIGSTSRGCIHHATCPVAVIP